MLCDAFVVLEPVEDRVEATIRFAGDAGDAMLLAGNQFVAASAACGNYVCSLPDPPAAREASARQRIACASAQYRRRRPAGSTRH